MRKMTESNKTINIRDIYAMFHQEYIIMAEYRMLQTENLEGIYVIPSYENSFLWFGVIFVRSGLYEGGVFRFTITLPTNFPNNEIPNLMFTSHLFHPAVEANSGLLHLSSVFPQWDAKRNHIWQILKYLLMIFQNPNVKVPANKEALAIYKSNRKMFLDKVRECVMNSIDHLYDEPSTEDKHYITFNQYDAELHETVKSKMLKQTQSSDKMNLETWGRDTSLQSFSKDN